VARCSASRSAAHRSAHRRYRGFLSGIFGHSTKKARLAIEADIKQKSKVIEDSYIFFRRL